MKNVGQMKEILSANKRRELIPAFLSLIEMEWPSVLPFVKRQLQDSFSSEENTVSSTYFLLVGGEPAGLISDQPKRVYPAQKGFVSLHRSAFLWRNASAETVLERSFWPEPGSNWGERDSIPLILHRII